jgi:hypothetical protein
LAFRARIYLQRPEETEAAYLGEIDLEVRPVLNGRARFMHDGSLVVGHIDTLTPLNWAEIGVVPTIYVAQRHRT